ncbi:MAG: alpha/beta hydrolase [Clostridiales bacterium]|nr:alpha/beta hydrolase [Clostridiales bacterium]
MKKKMTRKEKKEIRRKRRNRALLGTAAVTAVTAGAAAAAAYQFTFGRTKIGHNLSLGTRSDEFNDAREYGAYKLRELNPEIYEIDSARGNRLKGFYYPCSDEPTGKIAFIVHGRHTEHREAAGLYFEYYHKNGFDVFACDHTGAGESTGNLTGFGMYESEDCLLWLDFLYERFGEDIQVVLHGFSMGAATILKFCDYCHESVRFIVADSAYTDAASLLKPKAGVLYEPLRILNALIAGYDLSDMQVISHVADCDIPVLFVHGTEDTVVPFEMAEELYELHPGEKDCLFVEGAGHVEAMFKAKEEYEAKIDEFIKKYIIDYKW